MELSPLTLSMFTLHDEDGAQITQCPHCGNAVSADLEQHCGRCLARTLLASFNDILPDPEPVLRRLGDYALLEEIARGGMGVVFRARQVSLDREVAVKLLRDSIIADSSVIDRFRAEGAATAKLNHPNIVPVFEAGEADGHYFIAMALIEGPSLAAMIQNGPLRPRDAAAIIGEVAATIEHAHERGILHRDLKPGNVLLDKSHQPHVTDFGLARFLDRDSSMTLTGEILGTPAYMAPEQVSGAANVGPCVDVYSMGALLFHLLTGRAPFVGPTVPELLHNVLRQEPVSPRLLNPALPRDLASICLKCLRKEQKQRYQSARELAEDIQRFLDDKPTQARPTGGLEHAWRWSLREPKLAAAIAGLAILFIWIAVVSSLYAVRLRERLRDSLVAQSRAVRLAGRAGRRFDTLGPGAQSRRTASDRPRTGDVTRRSVTGAVAKRCPRNIVVAKEQSHQRALLLFSRLAGLRGGLS